MIYDISGRVVRNLTNNLASCIRNHISTVIWDDYDDAGKAVPLGVYFCQLKTAENQTTRKIMVIR